MWAPHARALAVRLDRYRPLVASTLRQVAHRPLGVTPVGDGIVDVRVWAPGAAAVAFRSARGTEALSRGARAACGPARSSAAPGDDYRFVVDGEEWPDPCSRWQPEGVRGPSRVVDTAALEIAAGPGLRLEELVVYELHVGTFSPEGTFEGAIPRLRALRELGVTAIELMPVATFPGEPRLGLRRALRLRAPSGLRRPERPCAARRRSAPRGPRRDPRRRLQPRRPGQRGAARVRPVLHRPLRRDAVGRGDRLRRARRPGVGDPERRALGARLPDRRAAPRRRARRAGRLAAARPRRARRAGARGRTRRARDQRDGTRRLPAAAGVGSRRDVARQPPPHAPRRADRRARRLLRAVRRLDRPDRPRARRGRRGRRIVVCAQNHDQVGNRAVGDRLAARAPARRAGGRPLLAVHAAALPGRGVRRVAPVPVLHRPHRPVHRRRDP